MIFSNPAKNTITIFWRVSAMQSLQLTAYITPSLP